MQFGIRRGHIPITIQGKISGIDLNSQIIEFEIFRCITDINFGLTIIDPQNKTVGITAEFYL